jgi:protein-tyrosine phosphatase
VTRDVPAIIDLHSHLVPGVDDGARTLDDGIEAVGGFARAGVSRLIATPHVDGALSLDPPSLEARLDQIRGGWRLLAEFTKDLAPGLEMHLGAEVMLSSPDVDLSNPGLRLAGGAYALVEWPGLQVPPGSWSVLSRLTSEGYGLVVAHPERYGGIDADLSIIRKWREAGATLQVNHGSLLGWYGTRVREVSLRMLRRGYVDYLSSDFHPRAGAELPFRGSLALFEEADATEQWDLLVRVNPGRLLGDEAPLPVPPLPAPSGLVERTKRLFRGW